MSATDFCIFVLYPKALLNSLISSNSLRVDTLGKQHYLQTETDLPLLFQFGYSVLLRLITEARPFILEGVRLGILVLFQNSG